MSDRTEDSAIANSAYHRARNAGTRGRSRLAPLWISLWKFQWLRPVLRRLMLRVEGGPIFSKSLREILSRYHAVSVGAYSYGPILAPGLLPPGTTVGRYCSVGARLTVRRRNHPIDRITQSPLFYNRALGIVPEDTIIAEIENPLAIGNDVWIGDGVAVMPGCRRIGNGAVVAAGAVVTRDVAPYSVVGGVPARPLKQRFDVQTVERLEASRWWEREPCALALLGERLFQRADAMTRADLSALYDGGHQQPQDALSRIGSRRMPAPLSGVVGPG